MGREQEFKLVLREAENDYPEIIEDHDEQLMNDSQLKRHCVEFAQQNFQEKAANGKVEGKLFLNKSMNAYVRFSNEGFSEWRGKARTRDHILAIKLINVFLENAQFSHAEPYNHAEYNRLV